ncbi:MAG: DUF5615 family PIN-like protein [Gammaproteobacteria bacterium]|nr:DUF5615 family PIN-like protein [Gammaproteobacteria bacterium]
MKLLLDENLSFRMLEQLEPAYPGSTQVRAVGMDHSDDITIWRYAKVNGFTLVTKDSDFHEFTVLHGCPPKVIWLKCGNKPNWYITALLISRRDEVNAFLNDPESSCLEVY